MKKLILLALMALASGPTTFQAAPQGLSMAEGIPQSHLNALLPAAATCFDMELGLLKAEYENGEVRIKLLSAPYIYEVERLVAGGGVAILDLEDLL